jgi:tRNA(fMet)-specific endonuclease VapC
MSDLVIDTSAYAAFKRGHPEALNVLRKASTILVPSIVLGELLAGFEVGSRRERNLSELEAFQDSLRVRTISITQETTERYAVIYAYLRSKRLPIPTNDLWIAAVSMEHGAELLTADAHFLQLPQIIVKYLTT